MCGLNLRGQGLYPGEKVKPEVLVNVRKYYVRLCSS